MEMALMEFSSPKEYRLRTRKPREITHVVLHQCGFSWEKDNPRFAKVRAHYVIQRSGRILALHPNLARLRYGSGTMNARCITIEHEGNYPSDRGLYYKPEKYGMNVLEAPQVHASRELIASLHEQFPPMKTVMAHRQISTSRGNCCGPDLYREVGQWCLDNLDMKEAETLKSGMTIPSTWKGTPTILGYYDGRYKPGQAPLSIDAAPLAA